LVEVLENLRQTAAARRGQHQATADWMKIKSKLETPHVVSYNDSE
jgi:hypothetical protein